MNNAKFEETYNLKVSDYNRLDRIAIHGVLDLMQSIAGKHANANNMSFHDLLAKNQYWGLVKNKFQLINEIPLFTTCKVITWPNPKNLVDLERQTLIINQENNEIVAKCYSQWVIADYNSRKIIPAKNLNITMEPCDEVLFSQKVSKLKDFDISNAKTYTYKIDYNDIDHNGHVNNVKYSYIIENAIRQNEDEYMDTFQIDYINETRLDDVITLYYIKEDKTYRFKAISNDKVIFYAQLTMK